MKTITLKDIETEKVKRLRFVAYDDLIQEDIDLLERYGIINGVGPEQYGKVFRWICTKLFSFLDYKRHDFNFFQQNGFEEANWGILKYSFISLAWQYKAICEKGFSKIYLIPLYYVLLPFKVLCILFAFNAVSSKAGLRAYNNSGL